MTTVICYDGSPSARRALHAAGELLRGESIVLLHVWHPALPFLADAFADPYATKVMDTAQVDREALAQARAVAEEGEELARQEGLEVESVLLRSTRLGRAILDYLERARPDLVILGTHGHAAAQPNLLGSVSAEVVRSAPVPVLIVPTAGPGQNPTDAVLPASHEHETPAEPVTHA